MGRNRKTLRRWCLGVAALGLFAALGCFLMLASAGLPYQDAPPELLAEQQARMALWSAWLQVSLVVAVIAVAAAWRMGR